MRMTAHAQARWRERHPGLDPYKEFAAARRAGKRLRLLLRGPEPSVYDPHWDGNRQYLITSSGVVFVVAADEDVVVTVLNLGEAKRRARALRRCRDKLDGAWVS